MSFIIYIMLLICAAVFYPLYEDELSLVILAALIVLPVIDILCLLYNYISLSYRVKCERQISYMGKRSSTELSLVNGGILPVSSVKADVSVMRFPAAENEKTGMDITISVPASSRRGSVISTDASHCGKCTVFIDRMILCDIMGFFRKKLLSEKTMLSETIIIPPLSSKYEDEAMQLIAEMSRIAEEDGDKLITTGPGEVIDFRDFRAGDRPVHIHHKLSARFDKDIVKVMGTGSDRRLLLITDLSGCKDADDRDALLQKVLSISYYLSAHGENVFLGLPENSAADIVLSGGCAAAVTDERSYIEAASELVCAETIEIPDQSDYICIRYGI